ncbi:MAG: hypothetical protein CMA27_00545 [Euryarchaeota archaeon]|nr:hypothetical protein [Euryarchaeota archaeon]|tara:strand:+ start:934 stop:1308 length:375 start_codon:yes stop_codon:yes gene_type:complete
MSGNSNLISLRLSDDELASIDQRIGLEGIRNRSDLLRRALGSYLTDSPELPGQERVNLVLGAGVRKQLRLLYQITGNDQNSIIKIALHDYLNKSVEQIDDLTAKLEERAQNAVDDISKHRSYKS